MTIENQKDLVVLLHQDIEQGEGQEIEFIKDFPNQAHDLAKEIAAFATSNPATIYLGVDNNGSIVGISATKELGKAAGEDSISNRLAGICQGAVRPAIVATADFIKVDDKVVAKINVPKGAEPIYYSNNIPYIRNLSSSGPATPDQVKELHRQYFLGQGIAPTSDETQIFLTEVLSQLSDFQILWLDHEKRCVNPDLEQMRYDLGSTGRMLIQLSLESKAKQLGLSDDLQQLGETLEEMERHRFYMDGGISWKAFTDKGDEALKLAERLLARALKSYQLQINQIELIKEAVIKNIRELMVSWRKRDQYLLRAELSTLKEVFRRLAYNFNRFANMPLQVEELDFSCELKQLAKNLRQASAGDYRVGYGFNPLERIETEIEETIVIAQAILTKIGS